MINKKLLSFSFVFVIMFFGLFLSNVSKASASTLYFNGAVDTDWNTLGNWCTDDLSPCTPALALPTSSDDVIILSSFSVNSNSGDEPSIKTLTVNSNDYNYFRIPITVSNGASFFGLSYFGGTLTGNATFNDSSVNGGGITGSATFNGDLSEDYSYGNNGGILGQKIRRYTSNINTRRDFVSDGPWTVVADNAVVKITSAIIDGSTTLEIRNNGIFDSSVETIVVNSLLDDDGSCTVSKCTLRDAIKNSNKGDTIDLSNLSGVISVMNQIRIDHTLIIKGPKAKNLTIEMGPDTFLYYLKGDLSLSNLIMSSSLSNNLISGGGNIPGGQTLNISNMVFDNNKGINISLDNANLIIDNSTFKNNTVFGQDQYGTVIRYGGQGEVTISNSTFDNNVGYRTGVIEFNGKKLTIINSTFFNNTSTLLSTHPNYGAIYSSSSNTNITNSTFSTTSSDQDYVIYISGVSNITNSIFYSVKDNNCAPGGTYTSGGHNIESGNTCGFNGTGDLVNPTNYQMKSSFNGTNGSYPEDSLTKGSDGKFYGMTSEGGLNNKGVIFSFDSTNGTYNKKVDLSIANGSTPIGSLVLANDGKFYGMTSEGGLNNKGVIFSYNPTPADGFPNGIYVKLYDFDGSSGSSPMGSLVKDIDGILYGMTYNGGSVGAGVIFSYNPTPTDGFPNGTYTKKVDFDWGNPNWLNGYQPWGNLTKGSDGKFYGMTRYGGVNDGGVIFSYEPGSTTFVKKVSLAANSFAYGSLTLGFDNKLYGMTDGGGLNNKGIIFSYDPSSDVYSKKIDLNVEAFGSLIRGKDNKLYGMTSKGNTIFSYDPTPVIGSPDGIYTTLYNFSSVTGNYPYFSSLIQGNDNKFYGMTYNGGASNKGVIFSYDLNPTQLFDPATILDPEGLKDNGGPVKTIALLAGSPAIDSGSSGVGIPTTDARDMPRLGSTDMGAFEYQGISTPPSTPTCYDGIQNQDETGIDTGGVCTPTSNPSNHNGGYSSGSYVQSTVSSITSPTVPIIKTNNGCRNNDLFDIYTGKRCEKIILTNPSSKIYANSIKEEVVSSTPVVSHNSTSPIIIRVLKIGMIGDEVKDLQVYLNTHGYIISNKGVGSPNHESNIFGPATKKALIKFQKDNNLNPDGILGSKTRELME